MIGTLWDSINLALFVAWLVAALAALHTNKNSTLTTLRNVTVTLNGKRAKNSYTTPTIANKHNGLETLLQSATYAVYPSSLETLLKQIMLKQETQTHNYSQRTEDATPAGVAAHSPSSTQSPTSRRQPSKQ